MNKYTVIGSYQENGQIFAHYVEAPNPHKAMYDLAVSLVDCSMEFMVVINGHHKEDQTLHFPGEAIVDSDTVLESESVYNLDYIESNESGSVLADFTFSDWRLGEGESSSNVDDQHKEEYRCVIKQTANKKQVFFKVYPNEIDRLQGDVTRNGLAGVIEINNGLPHLGLGIDDNDMALHITSDVKQGLHVYPDSGIEKRPLSYTSSAHGGLSFDTFYYSPIHDNGQWIVDYRSAMAEKLRSRFDFGGRIVTDFGGWTVDGDIHKCSVSFEEKSGTQSNGGYELEFFNGSTVLNKEVFTLNKFD